MLRLTTSLSVLLCLITLDGCDKRDPSAAKRPPEHVAPPTAPPTVSVVKDENASPPDEDAITIALRAIAESVIGHMKGFEVVPNKGFVSLGNFSIGDIDVVRQPNNVTKPYAGTVIIKVFNEEWLFTGELHLRFVMTDGRWLFRDFATLNYKVDLQSRLFDIKNATLETVLLGIQEHHRAKVHLWRLKFDAELPSK